MFYFWKTLQHNTIDTHSLTTRLAPGFLSVMGKKKRTVVSGGAMVAAAEVKTSKAYLETTIPNEKNVQPDHNGLTQLKEKSEVTNECLRRSGRLKSILTPSRIRVENPAVEHVNLDEKEKGEATPLEEKNMEMETRVDPVSGPPHPEVKELSLEEKVDYLVRSVDEFKPKVFGKAYEGSSSDLSYKSLYIDAQKKYEDLMEDHYEIVGKLEFAHGQIAAYEKMKDVFGDCSRGVVLLSDVVKLASTTTGAKVKSSSPETVPDCVPSPPAAADDNPNPMKRCRVPDCVPSPPAADPTPMKRHRKKKNNKYYL